jgi:hypothetical protein
MNNMLQPRLDILPPAQRNLWPLLGPATSLGFVLYGGTAIALRLGHRQSVDFDFFTERPLDRRAIRDAFPFAGDAQVLQDRPDTLTLLVAAGAAGQDFVRVSFFGGMRFGRVGNPEITADGVLQVASMDDMMATKLKVILQRIEAKDYYDISSLIGAGVELPRGLAAARAMFGPEFQPAESLKALVYFKGGDLHTLAGKEKERLVLAAAQVRDLPPVAILSSHLTL